MPTTFTSTSASTSSGQPSPSASPKNQKAPSVAAVAGGAVGGVVVLAVIILAIFLILRRRRLQSRSRQNIPVSPSVEFPATPKEQLVNRQTFGEEKGSLFAGTVSPYLSRLSRLQFLLGIDADPPGMPTTLLSNAGHGDTRSVEARVALLQDVGDYTQERELESDDDGTSTMGRSDISPPTYVSGRSAGPPPTYVSRSSNVRPPTYMSR